MTGSRCCELPFFSEGGYFGDDAGRAESVQGKGLGQLHTGTRDGRLDSKRGKTDFCYFSVARSHLNVTEVVIHTMGYLFHSL